MEGKGNEKKGSARTRLNLNSSRMNGYEGRRREKRRKSARIEMEYRRYCNALYYKKYQEREERRTKLF